MGGIILWEVGEELVKLMQVVMLDHQTLAEVAVAVEANQPHILVLAVALVAI
jgi:hypothetical protein